MNNSEQIHILRCALEWALKHGVKAVSWSQTGYWQQAGYDGMEIMPPAKLDRARRCVLASEEDVKRELSRPRDDQESRATKLHETHLRRTRLGLDDY